MDKFAENLRRIMEKKGAPTQKDLAHRVGKSPTFIHNLIRGKLRGTEETRRNVAEALGCAYEEMAGIKPLTCIHLRKWVIPRMRISDLIDQVQEDLIMTIVPVVSMDAARATRIKEMEKELLGWFAVLNVPGEHLVAVEMNDATMEPTIPKGSLLIVDLDILDVEDGAVYLCAPVSDFAVRQLFRQDDMVIATSVNTLKAGPHVFTGEPAEWIRGKVVRFFEPGYEVQTNKNGCFLYGKKNK